MKVRAILRDGAEGPELLLLGAPIDPSRLQLPLEAFLRRWFGVHWPAGVELRFGPSWRVQPQSAADRPLRESLSTARGSTLLSELEQRAGRVVGLEIPGRRGRVDLVFEDELRGWSLLFCAAEREQLASSVGAWAAEHGVELEKGDGGR